MRALGTDTLASYASVHATTGSLGVKVLLVVVVVLIGVVVGLVAGILSQAGGAHPTAAILRGGAACGATITLMILIADSLGILS